MAFPGSQPSRVGPCTISAQVSGFKGYRVGVLHSRTR